MEVLIIYPNYAASGHKTKILHSSIMKIPVSQQLGTEVFITQKENTFGSSIQMIILRQML